MTGPGDTGIGDDVLTVHVTVALRGGAEIPRGILRVRIEDISIADRPATVVGRTDVDLPAATVDVDVAVASSIIDPRASYGAFVHLDTNRSGQVDVGDWITTSTTPVLTRGAPSAVSVTLTPIR